MQPVVAVFASPDFLDVGMLRIWVRRLCCKAPETLVLLTDDPTDANSVLGRQLRCESVVHAIVRTATTLRGREQLEEARRRRDQAMVAVSTAVVTFGDVRSLVELSKNVTRY